MGLHTLWLTALALSACQRFAAAATETPALWWNMSAAVVQDKLGYSEQTVAFAAQGLVNRARANATRGAAAAAAGPVPTVYFDIGEMNYDWPEADNYWRTLLEADKRVAFTPVAPTLCALVRAAVFTGAIAGLVQWDDVAHSTRFGDGFSQAIALTIAAQRGLLPVDRGTLVKHGSCLGSLTVKAVT